MKASTAQEATALADIPNIGPAIVEKLGTLGIRKPADLKGKDAFALYSKLCEATATRHDPCLLDTFIAAVDFMDGAPARPWWQYTEQRKREYPDI